MRYESGFECSVITRKGGNRAIPCEAWEMPDRTCDVELTTRVLIWNCAAAGGISSLGGSAMQAIKFSNSQMIASSTHWVIG
ncbi:MAG TPA: hypothetical protein PKD85_15995 [Saprospiraceae bacterium]|nr:hypothetical protein [Saprospiraceae bacterium]